MFHLPIDIIRCISHLSGKDSTFSCNQFLYCLSFLGILSWFSRVLSWFCFHHLFYHLWLVKRQIHPSNLRLQPYSSPYSTLIAPLTLHPSSNSPWDLCYQLINQMLLNLCPKTLNPKNMEGDGFWSRKLEFEAFPKFEAIMI